MKLLILTQYFPPEVGAPQNRLYELAIRLQKKGFEISVLTAMPNYPQMEIHDPYKGKFRYYEEMNGLKVYRSWIFVSKSKSVFFRLLNYFSFVWSSFWSGWLRLGKFDYIICESPPLFLGLSAFFLKKLKVAKLIFNVSDLWPESAEKLGIVTNKLFLNIAYRLEEFLYKKSELITGQTQGIVKNISLRFPDKITYWLPNGVDIDFYNHANVKNEWRKENHFLENDFIVLYAGIIGHAQGLEVILNSAQNLIDKEDIKFILLGNGPEKSRLLDLKRNRRNENIFFFETLPKVHMPHVIGASDASIIPLRKIDLFKGAIPSKIFESLAMKKPILLGVEGEAKELFIDEGNCGLAFEPENAQDLTNKVLQLYNDRNLLRQLGENGRKYVAKKFNRDFIADEFLNFLTHHQS
ncbi:MAG: glycosyltransferase family 4 protein [Bacteroidetes bacterium]|nr:glycosyltransferase family 4 protein [Bacteroidota bacterium]